MLKVITVIGTRPELIKMSRVIAEFQKYTDHILVHTGQNFDYELNQVFFEELEIKLPKYFLNASGSTPAETIANVIKKIDDVLLIENPDAMLLYGDTNSCLSVISAKRRKIPIFHMEAGNRCFDQRVPEELNRKIVDHLSDVNFVITEHARRYLISEGIKQETIIKTGSHMDEVLFYYKDMIDGSKILEELKISSGAYFLVSVHREENVDIETNLLKILNILNYISEKYNCLVIVSTHPRTKKRLDEIGLNKIKMDNKILFLKPFGFFDYIKLQKNAKCVLSDSGTISEEASFLNFPAIMLRESHERPEGMDVGLALMSGLNLASVERCLEIALEHSNKKSKDSREVVDYRNRNASEQILRVVFSYVPYINRTVWSRIN